MGLLRRSDLADDLVQEVFQRAWQARDRYAEWGTPRAYLIRVADRLACDHVRRGQREMTVDEAAWSELEPPDHGESPGDSLLLAETRAALNAALNALSVSQRRVLLLRFYGELSFEEIAETMSCPLSTALSHCRRGLIALRQILAEHQS